MTSCRLCAVFGLLHSMHLVWLVPLLQWCSYRSWELKTETETDNETDTETETETDTETEIQGE